ncbi:Protein Abitram [Frankliniella fusca]|uniref:Protein Abitram n=1 Tax=Frankliniella fusca TaxID=407009 RepID=A0AAE1LBZ3_9NEOP|nr:Protein Abitram [Frankliniella fusca]
MQSIVVDPIGLDVPIQEVYPSFSERYFQPKYSINVDSKAGEDHCVLVHSNRICVVTLARNHPVISLCKTISKVNFQVTDKTNRRENVVQGKRKHGAQTLNPMSVLCVVECEDGSKYTVRSCVYGKLIEINENLVENPQLLLEKPDSDGYIAIVLPNLSTNEKFKTNLLSKEEYVKELEKLTIIEKN